GNEFGQGSEWNVNKSLDWHLLNENYQGKSYHRGIQQLNLDLNQLYRTQKALYELDFDAKGFAWIDCHDADQSIISFIRRGLDHSFVIIALNFTPVPRYSYRIGVPQAGTYRELFNSDAACYGGSNLSNGIAIVSEDIAWMNQPYSLALTLPPLAGIVLTLT
ncbi:MAG TPA: 1,4-alpha-glucan branching enzyme, partial [Methylophilaceae bacterium]|nr:1,4-alpha-glucan branching enzyme [Methylophilaceae bacterium]